MTSLIKKYFLSVIMLASFTGAAFASGGHGTSQDPRFDRFSSYDDTRSSYSVRITSAGHVLSDRIGVNELGDPVNLWGNVYSSSVTAQYLSVSSGILNVHETWLAPATASTSAYKANGLSLSTTTLVAAPTTFVLGTDYAQVTYPRNAVLVSSFTTGSASSSVSGSALLSGIDSAGRVRAETLSLSTNVATGSVAWATISSVTISGVVISTTSTSTITIYLGTGNKLGLANDLTDNGYIYKAIDGTLAITSGTYTANSTFNTYQPTNLPNSSLNYELYYHAEQSPKLGQ